MRDALIPKSGVKLRSDRDSNSGYPFGVYTLSRRASSATRASLLLTVTTIRCLWFWIVTSVISECKGSSYF